MIAGAERDLGRAKHQDTGWEGRVLSDAVPAIQVTSAKAMLTPWKRPRSRPRRLCASSQIQKAFQEGATGQ